MKKNVRVRFAPSPTGPQHIGGLRTALLNYLFAKKHKGTFILRIEDTDQTRLIPESEAYIVKALEWLDIVPDEGPIQGGSMGPYKQSERKDLYKKHALELVKAQKAYYAFDTPAELNTMRENLKAAGVATPQYNALSRMKMKNSLTLPQEEVARKIAAGDPYVVRILVNPKATIKLKDQVRGWVQVEGSTLDDKVLLKADGMASSHLTIVVDDHFMKISHVIRGEEWLPSTPIHVLLYKYLGWQLPEFVHLPLLLRTDGQGKLSKRVAQQGDFPLFPFDWQDATTLTTTKGFFEEGFLPQALCNFIALLGWHPSGNRELFDRQALIENFSLERITKSSARFDIVKAKWFNQQYLRRLPNELLATRYLLPMLQKENITSTLDYASAICGLIKQGATFPKDIFENSRYLFQAPTMYDKPALAKNWQTTSSSFLADCIVALEKLSNFDKLPIQAAIKTQIHTHQLKTGKAMSLIRLAITGKSVGPALAEVLSILGKQQSVNRIKKALELWNTIF